jgi:hypothetical protein
MKYLRIFRNSRLFLPYYTLHEGTFVTHVKEDIPICIFRCYNFPDVLSFFTDQETESWNFVTQKEESI